MPGGDINIVASVADRAAIGRIFTDHGIEAVTHAGALHKPDITRYPAQTFVDPDITGTVNLLEAAAAGRDRFIIYLLPMVINDIPPSLVAIACVTEAMEYGEDDITDFDVDLTDAHFRDISAIDVLDKIVKRL